MANDHCDLRCLDRDKAERLRGRRLPVDAAGGLAERRALIDAVRAPEAAAR